MTSPGRSHIWGVDVDGVSAVFARTARVLTRLGEAGVYVGDAMNVSFTLTDVGPADRGEEDRVTTTEDSIPIELEAQSTEPTSSTSLIPEPEVDVEPIMLTRDVLRALDSCGDYLRRHAQLFPESRWPNGVEVNQENCVEYHRRWDWTWAQSNMLTPDGQIKMNELAASRAREVHEAFGTGDPKRAAIFGYLISRCPRYRSSRLTESVTWAERHRDRKLIQAVDRTRQRIEEARHNISYAERNIETYRREIADAEASLPDLERQALGALARVAALDLAEAERTLRAREQGVAEARERVERQQAEVARLTALKSETTDATDATGDVTVPDDASELTGTAPVDEREPVF